MMLDGKINLPITEEKGLGADERLAPSAESFFDISLLITCKIIAETP